ncbi:MAG: diguanylate cyclase [Helicobacteraceae bacterium]|nr:diguanylate cyclase [Helicobacteraceae bacterium]
MNISIKKVFNNISIALMVIVVLLSALTYLIITQGNSYSALQSVQKQKALVLAINSIDYSHKELSVIQLDGKSNELTFEIDKLANSVNIESSISELRALKELFVNDVEHSAVAFNNQLNTINTKVINSMSDQFSYIEILSYLTFLYVIILMIFYTKRLGLVYEDIAHLFAVKDSNTYLIKTDEVNTITKRINQKQDSLKTPDMLDRVTALYNKDGMLSTFNEKKYSLSTQSQIIAIFKIDGIKNLRDQYPDTILNKVFKKVAFTISLHEQHNDLSAYLEENRFALLLTNRNKKEAKEIFELIKSSLNEFKVDSENSVELTLVYESIQKAPVESLENVLISLKDNLND